MAAHNWDLVAIIQLHPFCAITPGSEIRRSPLLAPLLDSHPLWHRFSERIDIGSHHPLLPISEPDRIRDLQAMLSRGNHKSARMHEAKLLPMLQDEVTRGWQLPLPLATAILIPGAVIGPSGMVHQTSIDEHTNPVKKFRLTHNQSFNVVRGSRTSVNDRLDASQLTSCHYGHALLRFLHSVASLRHRHPDKHILITKVEW